MKRDWLMSCGTSHELVFRHEGNARAAASVILVGVVATLIGSVFMQIGPKFKQEPRATRDTRIGEALAPVRIVGHAPRKNASENASCDQQVWPNIDQRCLVRTDATANPSFRSSPEQNDKLSPVTATATTTEHQSSSQANTLDGARHDSTAPSLSQRDALNLTESSDSARLPAGYMDELYLQEPVEPPRKRARRHYKAPFHFGGFRF
jgi:hypothetical protein